MDTRVIAREVRIVSPGHVDINYRHLPELPTGAVRVRVHLSGISPGTEMLGYRGLLPASSDDDSGVDPHVGAADYPMQTGYCMVGTVADAGQGVDPSWIGCRVFTFHPHATQANVETDRLVALPDNVSDELATFIPNLETAIGLVMDARPMLGERVVVLGQGIVGLLVTRLLSRFPLELLASVDRLPGRRDRSILSGATLVFDPERPEDQHVLERELSSGTEHQGADLVLELTGNPDALNDAIALAGYGGRIVAGSWYGNTPARLDLGGRFHRNRISLMSSQVSTVDPALSARWTKVRRMNQVLRLLPVLGLEELVTHRFPIDAADEAFTLLDTRPDDAMQVVLTCRDDDDGSS